MIADEVIKDKVTFLSFSLPPQYQWLGGKPYCEHSCGEVHMVMKGQPPVNSLGGVLRSAFSVSAKASEPAAPTDSLIGTLSETLSQNGPPKLLQDF